LFETGDPGVFIPEYLLVLRLRGEEHTDDSDRDVEDDCFSMTKVVERRLFCNRLLVGPRLSETGRVELGLPIMIS
jgi:hypothetical protein